MNRLSTLITFAIAALMMSVSCVAMSPSVKQSIDSLRRELANARTSADSVATLYNLYDILPISQSTLLGDTLYHTAMRAGEQTIALDIIRNQANRQKRNISDLKRLEKWAKACKKSADRKETLTFINLMDNLRIARYSDSVERENKLNKYIEQLAKMDTTDIYSHIALIHGICMFLSTGPESETLSVYMDSLSNLADRLPPSAYSLRNTINVHTATIYAIENPEKSLQADRKVLKDISRLEKYYRDNGRMFRNYHPSLYTIYTRMLSNFRSLSPDQIEEYYQKALLQIPADSSILNTYRQAPMADVYYAMSHKDYAKALPMLKNVIDKSYNSSRRLHLLRFMIESAEALGDNTTLLQAYKQYASALNDELNLRSSQRFKELNTARAIYDVKHRMGMEQLEQRKSLAQMQRNIIIISLCALVLLVIFVIFLLLQIKRNKQLAKNLETTNKQLVTEGENLRKSKAELIHARDQAQKANNLKADFIKNMSYEVKVPLQSITEYSHLIADCVSDGVSRPLPKESCDLTQKHLGRFADLLELNTELLGTIINDVLRLSEIENNPLTTQAGVVQLKTLCDACISGVHHRLNPGVTMTLDHDVPRIDFFTDPSRLQQILNNLLTNAAKFTTSGSIVLSYNMDEKNENLIFTVTDTGIGINPKNKDKIFERFVKLDNNSQGAGLGLTISRLLARHLGGELWLDTTYKNGARFCLSIPLH